jgi:glycosyltransferase involved in cell wall biosynthesis
LLGSVDVFHAPDFVGPWLVHAPLVITVHDLAPWLYPETRTWPNLLFYRIAFPANARRAIRVITDSESTRDDLCKWLPELEEKTLTVYLAPAAHYKTEVNWDVFEAIRLRLGLPALYILAVGTLEPRKNYPLLLEAFASLGRHEPEWSNIKLVIVGKKGWRYDEVFTTVRQLGLDERVILTDSLTDEELCQLYVHCQVFVLPSYYEGFGLPVLEAMACGAPVIISTAAALMEVAGDAAIAVTPNRVEDLVAALRTVVQDPQKRECLRQRGLERVRLFSWERAARETRRVYEEAVQSWRRRRV